MSSLGIADDRSDLGRVPDGQLVVRVRGGDMTAYAELWRRHRPVALGVARRATSTFEPDDLVAEAYAVILAALRRGGGPYGDAFRAYLCTTIRNLARRWGTHRHEIAVEELPEDDEGDEVLGHQLETLDERLVRDAFASLPPRWQEILWYTEIDGMSASEAASMLGLTPNATAVLAFRAREGLRKAWLQAHVADTYQGGECGWVLAHIGEHSRDGLRSRAATRVDQHLATCRSCRDVALEVGQVNRHLARILLPFALGGGAAAAWLATPAAPVAAATGLGAGAAIAAAAAAITVLAGIGGIQIADAPAEAAEAAEILPAAVLEPGAASSAAEQPGWELSVPQDGEPLLPATADALERMLVPVRDAIDHAAAEAQRLGAAVDDAVDLSVVVDPAPGSASASTDLGLGDGLLDVQLGLGDGALLGVGLDLGLLRLPDVLP